MQGLGRAVLVRAFGCAAATFATFLALPALASEVEPWPPSRPPGADDSSDENGAEPAAARPAPPEAEEPTSRAEPVTPSSAPDAGVLVVNSRAPRRNALEVGSRDGQLFVRTPGSALVLLPAARLEIDGSSLMTPDPFASGETLLIDRARVDLAGWLGSKVYFNLSADFAYEVSLRHADNFVAVAPWGDRAILQLGQFDAPFTLENRTSDRYLDFFDRGAAVRAFAIPENKDQGLMVHGTNPTRNFYYSAAVLNGEGPAVTGASGHVDVMARAWVAPFSFRAPGFLRDVTLGGSAWTGERSGEVALQAQSTQGGYVFLTPILWWMSGRMEPLALRQQGRVEAGALELNAPFAHRFGARFEWIAKRQPLAAFDTSNPTRPSIAGGASLSGWAGYAEIWGWVLGSDRLLGAVAAPGLELPVRYSDLRDANARGGLMLSARVDHIEEALAANANATAAGVGIGSVGQTRLTAFTLGGSYWYTRRVRLMVNYVVNRFDGVTPWLNGLGGKKEQEVLGRLALAL